MEHQRENTAILFFSRTAEEEASIKVFDSSISLKGNREIGNTLIEHSIAICKSSGYPLFQVFSNKQSGDGFGERLANAVENVFGHGYNEVIVIGSDCPFIDAPMIKHAADQLQADKLVLGPSTDGGVYLLAMSKANYKRKEFINLDWQCENLQASFLQYSTGLDKEIVWLEEQIDIDKEQDFRIVLKLLSPYSNLSKVLFKILSAYNLNVPRESKPEREIFSIKVHAQRGPPLAA